VELVFLLLLMFGKKDIDQTSDNELLYNFRNRLHFFKYIPIPIANGQK